MAKTPVIGKYINQMKELRDNNIVDEEINEKLETLQWKLDCACNAQLALRNMDIEERDKIMEEVEW